MKTLYNPTKNFISVLYKGNAYEIKPESSLVVVEELAAFWVKTHGFLQVSEYTVIPAEPKAPEVIEKTEAPVVEAPVVTEAPAKEKKAKEKKTK